MSGITHAVGSLFGSSANTDRNAQLAAQSGNWSLFNYGMGSGEAGQAQGQADMNTAKSTLGKAKDYWSKLMTAGRTDTADRAAPAVNQVLANATATRNGEGTFGTDRTGGTVAANREASGTTGSKIDDIISSTLLQGKEEGAQGLSAAAGQETNIASTELSNSLRQLGLSEESINAIMQNATQSRPISYGINQGAQSNWGKSIGELLTTIPGIGNFGTKVGTALGG